MKREGKRCDSKRKENYWMVEDQQYSWSFELEVDYYAKLLLTENTVADNGAELWSRHYFDCGGYAVAGAEAVADMQYITSYSVP